MRDIEVAGHQAERELRNIEVASLKGLLKSRHSEIAGLYTTATEEYAQSLEDELSTLEMQVDDQERKIVELEAALAKTHSNPS